MNLAVYSESNDILSFRSYFQSKGGTFFETPGIHHLLDISSAVSLIQTQSIFNIPFRIVHGSLPTHGIKSKQAIYNQHGFIKIEGKTLKSN